MHHTPFSTALPSGWPSSAQDPRRATQRLRNSMQRLAIGAGLGVARRELAGALHDIWRDSLGGDCCWPSRASRIARTLCSVEGTPSPVAHARGNRCDLALHRSRIAGRRDRQPRAAASRRATDGRRGRSPVAEIATCSSCISAADRPRGASAALADEAPPAARCRACDRVATRRCQRH